MCQDEEEGVDMDAMLAAIGDGEEVMAVKSEGEPSSDKCKFAYPVTYVELERGCLFNFV